MIFYNKKIHFAKLATLIFSINSLKRRVDDNSSPVACILGVYYCCGLLLITFFSLHTDPLWRKLIVFDGFSKKKWKNNYKILPQTTISSKYFLQLKELVSCCKRQFRKTLCSFQANSLFFWPGNSKRFTAYFDESVCDGGIVKICCNYSSMIDSVLSLLEHTLLMLHQHMCTVHTEDHSVEKVRIFTFTKKNPL